MLVNGQIFNREFVVSSEVYTGFLNIFNDHNPMHVDDQYAVAHGFPSKIMHGNILGGFLSYFVGECLPSKKVVIMSQVMNFHKPFFENDTLLFEAKLHGLYAEDTVGEFKYKFKAKATGDLIAKGKLQVNLLS